MSDKKKKAREKAVEMLRDRAMNNGLKNEAQQGARFQKANTPRKETVTSPQTKTTPKTNTSPTAAGKSFQSSVRTSQSPSATQKVFDKTARLTATDKYGDSSARGDGRGRSASATATYRDRHGVTLKTGRDVEKYDSDLVKNRANRSGYTTRGAVRQTVGGHLASLGTTAQTIETTARSYNKAKAKYESEANYKLRTREDALRREQDYNKRLGVKEGIDLKNVERRYDLYDPNSLSQKLIRTGDRYIEQGQKDIEKAKEGANGLQRLGVDLGANAIQMAGDRLMAFVPGVGQALAMGSLMNRAGGTASYEARQLGMNPDQQATYQQGTALIEGLSEGIFNSVSAFRSTYGKGAFSLADRVSTSKAAAKIVDRFMKSEGGKAFALNLARLGAQGFEEGIEEVVADLAEPALKYALQKSTDPSTKFEGYDIKNIAYDFLVGALMGAIPGGIEAATGIQNDIQMSKAMADGKIHADEVIARGLVQQRMGENGRLGNKTNAEVMAERLQQQQAENIPIQPIQMRVLEEALGESSEANARAFERKGQENERQAIEQGTLRPSTGTKAEQTAYERGEMALEDRNTETVKETVKEATGKDISENAAMAVGRVVSGTATNDDIDTILSDMETRQAAETVLDRKLSLNNAEARATLEDVITMNEVANKDTLRAEVQKEHAGDIAREVNMSKRGGKLFTENYSEAVDVIGNPSVYEDVFIRLYSDGMIQDSDFNDVYDRVVGSYGGRVADYFTKDVALKAFNEGRIAMAENKAKSSANIRAKISEGSYGAFVESDAEAYLNEAQRDALDKMAKRGNVTIHIVKSIPILDENGKPKLDSNGKPMSANGYYKNGVITIAADSDNKLITVAKHELTHHIKKISPKRYQELEDFVFKKWYDSDPEKMEDEIRKKQLQYQDITVEEAREEIIADASEAFFTDEGAIHEVMSFSEKLGKAIHDGIHALLDSFIGLDRSQRYAEDGEEGYRYQGYGDFLKDLGILRDAERMWLEALESGMHGEEATEIGKATEESETKHSLKATDQAYLDAVNKGDMKTAQKMVDEAAKKAGLTNRLMHGTNSFGFTTVEYGKGDDHISFFATDSEEVASSYVRPMFDDDEPNTYVRSIGKPIKNRVNEQSPIGDIINALNKVRQSSYKVATEEIIKNETDKQFSYVLEDAKELDRYTLPDKVQDVIEKVANSKDPQEAISLMDSIKDVHDIYYNDMLFYQATAKLSSLKSNVDLLKRELQWTPDNIGYWDINGHKNFVSKADVYEEYLDETGLSGRGIYELYASTNNPLTIYCNGSTWDNIKTTGEMADDLGQTATTRQIAKWAYDHGYGTVIFDYVRDTGKYGDRFTNPSTVYTFLEGGDNVIKSADPVTYDDNGDVIPLSERFNDTKKDLRYSIKEAPPMSELDKSGATLDNKSGSPVAKFETDGSAQFSIRTYDESGRKLLRDYLDNLVENNEFTQEEADNMFNEIETLYSVVKQFADKKDKNGNPLYAPFTAWSYGDIVVGEDGKPVFSAIKKNSEYKMNIDFSTICKKRRTLDNVFRVMINRGLFEKLDLNKDESAALVVNINDLIRSRGFEAACALCFVEARRYRQQQTAQTFTNMWNGLVESMYDDASKISYFNYGEDTTAEDVPDGIHTFSDEDLNLSYLQKLATEKNDKGGLKQTAEAKAARLILRDPSQRKLMRVGDMMASTGFENMQVKNPELMKIYNSKKGTGGAKSSFGDVQYLNEIIGSKTFSRTAAYNVSGVRIQSFSDYVPRMVFDYIQVIGDLAAKKLPAHAYTKEVLFALQFGLTGVKINMSLVPDVVKDGIAPGLDKDGNYIWNTDGTFPYEEALKIQEAEGYKENCGTIAVGISDKHIWKMLHDPTIQMVIPYHKSSLNPLVAAMTNVSRFTDYTDFQNTKDANGNTVKKDFDWDKKLYKLSHGKNGKLLPKSEWGDIQELVREYVDWCEERGYTPKFSQFLYARKGDKFDGKIITDENGNKVIDSGYYKMLEDFGLLDNEGNFKPQDDVRMRFPTKESAFGSMESLIKRGLEEDTNLEADRSSKIKGIVDEIETMIDDGSITKQTIFSEALASKMTDADKFSLKSNDTDAFFNARKEQELWNAKGKEYFDKATAFYSQYQEGQANKDNFFEETIATFKQIPRRPSRKPDHTSYNRNLKVSSEYWYTEDGVIRGSNHWGTGVASCDWALEQTNGRTLYGREGFEPTITPKVYAKAKWSDFILKTNIKGDQTLTSFDNPSAAKFSLKTTDNNVSAQNTIAKLEQNVADLKAEFKRTDLKTADPKDVRVQAGKLLKRHDSNLSMQKDLENTFNEIFRLYKEEGEKAFDKVYEIAKDAAVGVVNNIGFIHDEGAEEYKAIKEYLKTTEITVDDAMKKNITDYEDFRKKNLGRLKLKNGSQSNIDNVYMELSELFPEQFTDDYVNPADQLYHMVDVLDSYKPYYETLDGASEEMQDYVVDIASDIMETAYNLQTKKTFADKKYLEKEAAVKKAREEALASRNKALERTKQRYEKKLNDLKEHNKEMNDKARARREAAEEKEKAERREKREAKRERKQESEARTRLLEIARRLDKMKGSEDFEKLKKALIGELDLEAKSMTGKTRIKLEELEKWYYDQVQNNDWFVPSEKIEKKFERLKKTQIAKMELDDVKNLTEILLMLEHKMRMDKKLINSEYKHDIFRAGIETSEGIKRSKGLRFKGLHKIDNVFVGQTLSPVRYIRRLTGYDENNPLMIATRELQAGEIKQLDYRMNALKPFVQFADHKFTSYLNGSKAPIIKVNATTVDMKPTTVEIIPAIRIWFYLSAMNADNMRHIVDGAVHIPDAKLLKKGKRTEAYDEGKLVRFSKSQVMAIINGMTAEEKRYAQAVYYYFNKTAPEATNAVSEQLDGISIAKVKNYIPISVDRNFLEVEADTIKRDGTLEGMGSHKERVQSTKPVYAEDISDVLMRAIEADAKYVGLAIPIRNFNKIYNASSITSARGEAEHKQLTGNVDMTPTVTNGLPSVLEDEETAGYKALVGDYMSVQETIKKMWTSDAIKYIDDFISDLQFAQKDAGTVEKALRSLTSNYAGAVLSLNASVAVKQAASFPTAAAIIGWKPLLKSMGRLGKLDLDYVDSVTPLLNYRTEGFNFREAGDIQNRSGRDSFMKKMMRTKALNWIQGMDVLTTRKLFKAAQAYVEDNYKLQKGSEAYDKKVAEIYNRIITETQPNYTVLERPGHLRSDSTLERTLSMFKTQPYQNFNIWYDATGNYLAKRESYRKNKTEANKKLLKEATTDLYRATTSQVAQLAVFAAMASLWALFRRKDDKYRDEEGNITFGSYMKQLSKDMLSGFSSEIFLGSEVFSSLDSKINGTYYTGFSSITDSSINDILATMNDTMSLIGDAWDKFTKGEESDVEIKELLKQTEKVAKEAGRFTGIPTGNIRNLVNAMYEWGAMAQDGKYIGKYEAQKMSFAKDTEMKDNLFAAYRNNKKAYEDLRKMMIDDGFEEDKLDAYLKKKIKENPSEEEEANYEKSMDYLKKNNLWKMDSLSKETYEADLRKIALGIADSDTARYTKYENIGITPEENILIRLAMEKVDKTKGNANGYLDAEEKKEAIKLLTSLNLSAKEKEAILGDKWSYKKG